ncbi:hypothetical protein SAMN05421761_1174 [Belliella pelovolcani]|jgi:hypothetical protein|uniref:Uncharacterized protein n=1 Tax=Belliella pelovolcani TaxID=529505 RepID=A0A1N7PK27_9BACT|nr:hypothetical protein SAMN05421761_1174 [Belliella pelovolcani]
MKITPELSVLCAKKNSNAYLKDSLVNKSKHHEAIPLPRHL